MLLASWPLYIFTFGAMAFCTLAWSYWRERSLGTTLFHGFTFLCAAAFVLNLSAAAIPFWQSAVLDFAREHAAALLPPVMLHLVVEKRSWSWKLLLYPLYFASLWTDASAWVLGIAASAAIAALTTENPLSPERQRHRIWNLILFGGFLVAACGSPWIETPLWDLLPDYLLLILFGVRLYYCERLAFFDVFLKRGLYFLSGALLVSLTWKTWPAMLLLWMVGPSLYQRLSGYIDRRVLGRRYTALEAERALTLAIQGCSNEDALQTAAESSLSDIFTTQARVNLNGPIDTLAVERTIPIPPRGSVGLERRDNGVPYLSGDLRLLDMLAANIGAALQNLHLRQRQSELAEQASRAELRALRAQINPHFLFNALNAIAGSIRARPELADDTIARLADVFRYALNRSGEEWAIVEEEIDFVKSYLAVEQARFGDRLVFVVECEEATHNARIPTMLIQPLVENAMRHGVGQLPGIGRIQVHVRNKANQRLRIEVTDNGAGFPDAFTPTEGHGLGNIAARLNGYYGEQATLQWKKVAAGCMVAFEVPLHDARSNC